MYHGILVIDKPLEITSTRVSSIIKRTFKTKKIGHIGTLDPLASGVLVLALGEATKIIPHIHFPSKVYVFDITFGESRTTDDREGEVLKTNPNRPLEAEVTALIPSFLGEQDQIPPCYSAIHINGQRAYDLARKGVVFDVPKRKVFIHNLELLNYTPDKVTLRATCGPGTYIRSLGRDMAQKLGTEGYISSLRRERDGKFSASDAISLEKIEKMTHKFDLEKVLIPISSVLDDIPAVTVSPEEVHLLKRGQKVAREGGDWHLVLAKDLNNNPVCMGNIVGGYLEPKRVFNLD
jgi:tRNA pseudouridine55 synthase